MVPIALIGIRKQRFVIVVAWNEAANVHVQILIAVVVQIAERDAVPLLQMASAGRSSDIHKALPFPIATGERLVGRWEYRELFEKRACAIVQPDCSHCGGITEVRKIAAMAETYLMSVACHNPQGPISTAACTHHSC